MVQHEITLLEVCARAKTLCANLTEGNKYQLHFNAAVTDSMKERDTTVGYSLLPASYILQDDVGSCFVINGYQCQVTGKVGFVLKGASFMSGLICIAELH